MPCFSRALGIQTKMFVATITQAAAHGTFTPMSEQSVPIGSDEEKQEHNSGVKQPHVHTSHDGTGEGAFAWLVLSYIHEQRSNNCPKDGNN
jgi:hypothetical protein